MPMLDDLRLLVTHTLLARDHARAARMVETFDAAAASGKKPRVTITLDEERLLDLRGVLDVEADTSALLHALLYCSTASKLAGA